MSPQTLLILLVGVLCFNFVLDKVLEYLNMQKLDPELPPRLSKLYDETEYRRSQEYLRSKMRFGLFSSTLSFVVMLAVLLSGFFGLLDGWLRNITDDPVWLALLFFGVLMLASDLLSTPFAWYKTFVLEERFGFNKTTKKTFVMDKLKGYLVGIPIGGGIFLLLMLMLDWWQADFWLWFWLAVTVIMLGFQYLYSTLLLPIFNKLTPLEPGELRTAIEEYAKQVDFPLTNVMVMDGSKRSTKANAFFAGFGKNKRIVLYDTLIEQMTTSELVAVLAHEVGHYKRRHIVQGMVASVLNMGVMLFILSRFIFAPGLSIALGAEVPGIHLNLIAFAMLYSPISQIVSLAFNLLSRKNEYEADAYALQTHDGPALGSALAKLHVKTLSNLQPHPAYVFFHYSHPTLMQRLQAMRIDPTTDTPIRTTEPSGV